MRACATTTWPATWACGSSTRSSPAAGSSRHRRASRPPQRARPGSRRCGLDLEALGRLRRPLVPHLPRLERAPAPPGRGAGCGAVRADGRAQVGAAGGGIAGGAILPGRRGRAAHALRRGLTRCSRACGPAPRPGSRATSAAPPRRVASNPAPSSPCTGWWARRRWCGRAATTSSTCRRGGRACAGRRCSCCCTAAGRRRRHSPRGRAWRPSPIAPAASCCCRGRRRTRTRGAAGTGSSRARWRARARRRSSPRRSGGCAAAIASTASACWPRASPPAVRSPRCSACAIPAWCAASPCTRGSPAARRRRR